MECYSHIPNWVVSWNTTRRWGNHLCSIRIITRGCAARDNPNTTFVITSTTCGISWYYPIWYMGISHSWYIPQTLIALILIIHLPYTKLYRQHTSTYVNIFRPKCPWQRLTTCTKHKDTNIWINIFSCLLPSKVLVQYIFCEELNT